MDVDTALKSRISTRVFKPDPLPEKLPDRRAMEGIAPAALELLRHHSWPGNVRELEHVIERALLRARGQVIQPGDLGLRPAGDDAVRLDDMSLEEVESHLIRKTLARCQGNAQKAAEALGLSRSAFYRRLEKYRL